MKFMCLQCVVSVTIETPPLSYAYQIIKWTVRFKKLSVRITLSVLRKRRPRKIYNLSWHDLNSHTFNMAKFVRDLHCIPVQGTWTIARSFAHCICACSRWMTCTTIWTLDNHAVSGQVTLTARIDLGFVFHVSANFVKVDGNCDSNIWNCYFLECEIGWNNQVFW